MVVLLMRLLAVMLVLVQCLVVAAYFYSFSCFTVRHFLYFLELFHYSNFKEIFVDIIIIVKLNFPTVIFPSNIVPPILIISLYP